MAGTDRTDLAQGSIRRLVLKTAIPMVIAQVISMIYNLADRMFVGRIEDIGVIALGGVGIYMPVSIIIMAFSLWIGGGGAPKAAICLGKGEKEQAEKILGVCIAPLIFLSLIAGVILLRWGPSILPLFGATEANISYALQYSGILALGIPFSMLTTGLNSFINTQGKTQIGMMSVMIGAILNIILDAVFILKLGWGVEGAAWATVIGQAVSGIWVVGFLLSSKSEIRIRRKNLFPDFKLLGGIITLGFAAFFTTAVESFVTILLNYALKKYGALAFGGYLKDGSTLAISIGSIITMASAVILMPVNGFTQGVQPVISYNYGAGKRERVEKAIRFSCMVCTAYTGLLCLVMITAPRIFVGLFTTDPDLIQLSGELLRIFVLAMTLSGIQSTLQMSFVARGLTKYAVGIAFSRKLLYVPLLLLLPALVSSGMTMKAIYAAEPVSDLFAVAVTVFFYVKNRNAKTKKD